MGCEGLALFKRRTTRSARAVSRKEAAFCSRFRSDTTTLSRVMSAFCTDRRLNLPSILVAV